jgi:hypothetical protein
MMKKVTKAQVMTHLKKLKGEEEIQVSLFPSNCGPGNAHFLGYDIHLKNEYLLPKYPGSKITCLDSLINEFVHYNCNNELGKRVHFYINE